jgi:hypothetical protein
VRQHPIRFSCPFCPSSFGDFQVLVNHIQEGQHIIPKPGWRPTSSLSVHVPPPVPVLAAAADDDDFYHCTYCDTVTLCDCRQAAHVLVFHSHSLDASTKQNLHRIPQCSGQHGQRCAAATAYRKECLVFEQKEEEQNMSLSK